ncbi:hypothetical protein, partial [Eggerthella sp. BIOML-A3]|uniref:hypothetical protein n=1 Tax=Eggerthella sp. BIOML-A3 TaxID=2584640 RepID=UPI0019596B68
YRGSRPGCHPERRERRRGSAASDGTFASPSAACRRTSFASRARDGSLAGLRRVPQRGMIDGN